MDGEMGPFDLDLQVERPSEASEEYVEELGLTSSGGLSGTEMGAARYCCGCKFGDIPDGGSRHGRER